MFSANQGAYAATGSKPISDLLQQLSSGTGGEYGVALGSRAQWTVGPVICGGHALTLVPQGHCSRLVMWTGP